MSSEISTNPGPNSCIFTRRLLDSSRAEPRKAFDELGPAYQGTQEGKDFIADWQNVALAERVSPVRKDNSGLNRFTSNVRLYRVDSLNGDANQPNFWEQAEIVDVISMQFRLEKTDSNDILVTRIDDSNKISGQRRNFALAAFSVTTHARRGPHLWSKATRATDVPQGKSLRLLCHAPNDPSWFLTYIGWFTRTEFRLTQLPAKGILTCATSAETGFSKVASLSN